VSEIKRRQYDDDIVVENGSAMVFRSGWSGEISLKVRPVSGGTYNELRVRNEDNETFSPPAVLAMLHEAIGDMLTELNKRGSRS